MDQQQVAILGSNFGLMINREPLTCRSPDLALYWRECMVVQDGLYHSPPDLIIEILSPSENRRRKEEKIEDYASIGVPEVWLCSHEAQSLEIRQLSDGQLKRVAILIAETVQPTRFPSVSIHVPEVWPA